MSSNASHTARGVLIQALMRTPHPPGASDAALREELLRCLPNAQESALGEWLAALAGADTERRAALADEIGNLARDLAPAGDPPSTGPAASAWVALVTAADRLHGSGVYCLGHLPFVSERLHAALLSEARELQPDKSWTSGRTTAGAGDVLAGLAVSRQLREAVSEALGAGVMPTYDAVYEYDPPRSHIRTHLDARHYEIVVHLLLEHTRELGEEGESVLVSHHPAGVATRRLNLRPGQAIALRGRGTIHSWEALRADERRTLTAIGFELAS